MLTTRGFLVSKAPSPRGSNKVLSLVVTWLHFTNVPKSTRHELQEVVPGSREPKLSFSMSLHPENEKMKYGTIHHHRILTAYSKISCRYIESLVLWYYEVQQTHCPSNTINNFQFKLYRARIAVSSLQASKNFFTWDA